MTQEIDPREERLNAPAPAKPTKGAGRRWLITLGVAVVVLFAIGGIIALTQAKLPEGPRSASCTVPTDLSLDRAAVMINPDRWDEASPNGVWYLESSVGRYTVVRLDNDVVLTFIDETGSGGIPNSTEMFRRAPVDKVSKEWVPGDLALKVTPDSPGYNEARSCAAK